MLQQTRRVSSRLTERAHFEGYLERLHVGLPPGHLPQHGHQPVHKPPLGKVAVAVGGLVLHQAGERLPMRVCERVEAVALLLHLVRERL
eukprot:7814853-Pyramimonas_sp.AAC.1